MLLDLIDDCFVDCLFAGLVFQTNVLLRMPTVNRHAYLSDLEDTNSELCLPTSLGVLDYLLNSFDLIQENG